MFQNNAKRNPGFLSSRPRFPNPSAPYPPQARGQPRQQFRMNEGASTSQYRPRTESNHYVQQTSNSNYGANASSLYFNQKTNPNSYSHTGPYFDSYNYSPEASPYFSQPGVATRPNFHGNYPLGIKQQSMAQGGLQLSQTSYMTNQFMTIRNQNISGNTLPRPTSNPCNDINVSEWSNEGFNHPKPTPFKIPHVPIESKNKDKCENSLRFVTVNPTYLKVNNCKENSSNTLYEIFGTLSSAVTKGIQLAMHFCLRSGCHVLPCVFYEIDRPLDNLIREKLYRCVGSYNNRGLMRCVSVRLASVEEKAHLEALLRLAAVPESEP